MGIKPKGAKATPTTVTQKHLAADIAAAHDLSKKAGEAILNDVIALLVKNLKKGARIRLAGLGVLQVRKPPPAWAATRRRAKPSRSRRARRSLSARPRSSRKRSKPGSGFRALRRQ